MEGKLIIKYNPNTILDSRLHKVEFIDGTTETLSANVIYYNILAQADYEVIMQLMIDKIVDHICDQEKSITKEDEYMRS